jgi:hypothetical protein
MASTIRDQKIVAADHKELEQALGAKPHSLFQFAPEAVSRNLSAMAKTICRRVRPNRWLPAQMVSQAKNPIEAASKAKIRSLLV